MGWPFPFPENTPEIVDARRHTLDKFGTIAQLSAITVLLLVGLYQWVLNRRATAPVARGPAYAPVPTAGPPGTDDAGVEMQSPAHFADALDADEDEDEDGKDGPAHGGPSATPQVPLPEKNELPAPPGRLAAWLDTPLREGWKETRRQAVAVGVWAVWIVSLVFRETDGDYLHLTKRFAHIAVALLPFHYLLGTPSPLSPLPRLFRVQASFIYNPYHRLHALLIFALLTSHATWYLNYYLWNGKLPGRLFDLDVLLGLSMVATLTVLAVLARQSIRYDPKRRAWFVGSHLFGAGILPALLFFHAAPARWYAAEIEVVYVGVLVGRWWKKRQA